MRSPTSPPSSAAPALQNRCARAEEAVQASTLYGSHLLNSLLTTAIKMALVTAEQDQVVLVILVALTKVTVKLSLATLVTMALSSWQLQLRSMTTHAVH